MNKKTKIAIIGIIALVLVTIGVTYAYWLITRTQQGENVITTGCLDITLSGENDITLSDQFPMSDEDGMKLTPYTFTVTNNCNTSVDYQIALEALESGDEIASSAIKVALNDDAKLYNAYSEVASTISGAYESRLIGFSRLAAKGSEEATDSYSLRIWIDKDASINEMNKTFKSKISVTIGQGVEIPYKEGTIAYNILSNCGGTGRVQTLINEPTEMITATGTESIPISSNYYYGTEKVYDPEEGTYTLGGTIVQAKTSECRDGTKTCGKYTLKKTTETATSSTIYEITDFGTSGKYVTANTLTHRTEFYSITTAADAGVYKTSDDLGDSYYFRGNPTNNYVEFGTYAEDTTLTVRDTSNNGDNIVEVKAGTPMYWRIVRVNGDGSIRLIYDGIEKVANGIAHTTSIAKTAYNTNFNEAKYVGYTYDVDGTETDSTIKDIIDTWYEANLKTNYETYIADGIFCNDRSGAKTDDTKSIYYAPYNRLRTRKAPVLTCANKIDRYTKEDTTNGNGLLSNPVGLLTADEVYFAGGNNLNSNSNYYLYSKMSFWTSTPLEFNGSGNIAIVWNVEDAGNASVVGGVNNSYPGVRPVINLKADVQFTGNGTIDSPYQIVMG